MTGMGILHVHLIEPHRYSREYESYNAYLYHLLMIRDTDVPVCLEGNESSGVQALS